MNSQHDDFNVGRIAYNFARGFQPANTRHVHIHKNDIYSIATAPFHGVFTALGLPDNFYTFDIFKNASYPCAHQFVVINKKNVDQRTFSRIGITLWTANSAYINGF
ncbi:hypothetical protein D3C71_1914160 [compost metagenome]